MIKCPYCAVDSPEEYNFCIGCEKQLKCTNPECGSLLVAGKTRCLKCGRSLVIQETPTTVMNSYIRTIDQTTKTYRERTEIRASDDAVGQMAPLLSGVPAFRPARPNSNAFSNNNPLQNPPLLIDSKNGGQVEEAAEVDENPAPAQPSMSAQGDASSKALKIFVVNEQGGLVARVRDFKGNLKKSSRSGLWFWLHGLIINYFRNLFLQRNI